MRPRPKTNPKAWEWPEAADYISNVSFFAPPSLFAKTLAQTIPIEAQRTRLLDLGSGSGIIGLYCLVAKQADFVTFTDIQVEAVAESFSNVARQIERNAIREGSIDFIGPTPFSDLRPEVLTTHTLVAFNPPQIPEARLCEKAKDEIKADPSTAHFRLGGKDGLEIVRQFLQWYKSIPKRHTKAVLVLSSFLGQRNIEKAFDIFWAPDANNT